MTTQEPRTAVLGLNRRMIRAIYPQIDWDEYDREVVAEAANGSALDADGGLISFVLDFFLPFLDYPHEAQERQNRIDERMRASRVLHLEYARLSGSPEDAA